MLFFLQKADVFGAEDAHSNSHGEPGRHIYHPQRLTTKPACSNTGAYIFVFLTELFASATSEIASVSRGAMLGIVVAHTSLCGFPLRVHFNPMATPSFAGGPLLVCIILKRFAAKLVGRI